jgi:hypothetical protein
LPGVVTLLALAVAAAQLLRDGSPVVDLKLSECMVYEVPGKWRAPVQAARKADSSSLQKQFYSAFLKKRYGYQIAALNQAYGLEASSFTELASFDFAQLDENRLEVLADDVEFASEIFVERVESALRGSKAGRFRLVEIPDGLPEALVKALSSLAVVDGILVHNPVKGTVGKAVVLWNCPAVRPAFATACLRI